MRNTTALCAGQGWGQMGIGFLHDLLLPSHVTGRGANVWERRRWLSPEALDFLDGLLRYDHQVGTGVLTLELRVVVCVRRGGGSHFQAPAEVGAQYITSLRGVQPVSVVVGPSYFGWEKGGGAAHTERMQNNAQASCMLCAGLLNCMCSDVPAECTCTWKPSENAV